jgi:diacylglycerol kinase (ATP)
MLVRAIVNPIAGRRANHDRLPRLAAALRAHGGELEVFPTRGPGDATRLAAETPADARAVLVRGGDGTVREAIDGLVGRPVPLIVLPAGTENIVARHFGFTNSVDAVVRTILHGQPTPQDVGVINGKPFFIVVGVGFDAEIVHQLAQSRRGHISYLTYVRPIWQTFWRHRFPPVRVYVDDRQVFEGPALAFVGNLPRYAIGLRLLAQARSDDGLLDVCILPCAGRATLLGHALRTLGRAHVGHAGVQYYQTRSVRIEAAGPSEVPVEIDGDPGGHLPIDCSILPSAVQLLLPPPESAAGSTESRSR